MPKAFRVFWSSIGTVYGELFPFAGMTLLWFVFSLPIGAILLGLFAVVGGVVPTMGYLVDTALYGPLVLYFVLFYLLIAPNPAAAGIHYYANQAARRELLDFSLFWTGLRRYFVRSTILFGISVLGFLLILFNLSFYASSENDAIRALSVLFLYVLYFWLSMQLYVLPLLIEHGHKSALSLVKSAALVALGTPGFTLILFVLLAVWALLCMLLSPLIPLASAAVVAVVANKALLHQLEKHGLYKPPEELL